MSTNEYGLDADYFRRKLERVLRDVNSYKPDEMARELARMARTADETVMCETEFAQQPAPVAVQEGGKLVVPVDADLAMVDALKACIAVTSRGGILNAGKALNDAIAAAPTAPAPAVRMCKTMQRPVTDCGCPDCGSSLIDWPKPTAQEPVQMHHEPHNRAMWHTNCPGRRWPSPMRPVKTPSGMAWECVCCKAVGYTATPAIPPAAEQPYSTTSDKYRAELYDEVWEKARSMGYGNVTMALDELEQRLAAEQPDTMKTQRVILDAQMRKPADLVTGTSNWAAYMARALLGKEGEA